MERWAPRVAADSMYLEWGILALSGEFLPLPILRVSSRAGGVARTVGVARNRGVARTSPLEGVARPTARELDRTGKECLQSLKKRSAVNFGGISPSWLCKEIPHKK